MNFRKASKVKADFSMASMTDIVFLLLIFFLLTSTLVAPQALKLLLPKGKGQTVQKQAIRISIDSLSQYYLDDQKVNKQSLKGRLLSLTAVDTGRTLMLQSHRLVPVQEVVDVMQWAQEARLKMVLATDPR
ncbi:MAG: biopolymer transporter ExbD [Sphingomonadales bacterium]|nr:biopolymer transporter ExbD [Sphingomonadales bacterium]